MPEPDQLTFISHADFNTLLASEKPDGLIILTFVSDWAGPCNLFDRTLDRAEQRRGDDILFLYCDVDHDKELANQYDCRSLPSFVLFRGGELVAAAQGAINTRQLLEWIDGRLGLADDLKIAEKKRLTRGKKS